VVLTLQTATLKKPDLVHSTWSFWGLLISGATWHSEAILFALPQRRLEFGAACWLNVGRGRAGRAVRQKVVLQVSKSTSFTECGPLNQVVLAAVCRQSCGWNRHHWWLNSQVSASAAISTSHNSWQWAQSLLRSLAEVWGCDRCWAFSADHPTLGHTIYSNLFQSSAAPIWPI